MGRVWRETIHTHVCAVATGCRGGPFRKLPAVAVPHGGDLVHRRFVPWLLVATICLLAGPVGAQDDPADAILDADPADALLADDPADTVLDSDRQPEAAPGPELQPETEAEPEPQPEPALEPPPLDEAGPEPAPQPAPESDLQSAATVAVTPPAATDPALSLLDEPAPETAPSDPADIANEPPASDDIADEILAAPAGVTAPDAATQEEAGAYEELRTTIAASVQVRTLGGEGEMLDGILLRRGFKGAKGASGQMGFTGVFRAISADLPPTRSFRFGSHFSFYVAPDLWDNTKHSDIQGIGFFSYSVREDLELRVAAVASGHRSGTIPRFGQEALFQTLGDVFLGGKYSYRLLPYLSIAGIADLHFFTKVGSFLLRGDATSFLIGAASTLDLYRANWFRRLTFPIRLHANLLYSFDRSFAVMRNVSAQNASTFGGFGLAPGDSINFVVGTELIMKPRYSLFGEYSAEPNVISRADGIVTSKPRFLSSPQRLTFGGRYNPVENIVLDGAIDISAGLNKAVKLFAQPEPPGPPYRIHFGVTYEWNPESWEVIDMRGKVVGIVVDADSGEPLGGAVIEYINTPKSYNPQVANLETGMFETYKLPPGEVLLRVAVEGYEPVVINPVVQGQDTVEQKIFLRRASESVGPTGILVGQVVDGEGLPVTATIAFLDTDLEPVRSSATDGSFTKILPPGLYRIEVRAEGYEGKVYEVPIEQDKRTTIALQVLRGDTLGALGGVVRDADGRPVQATLVFLDAQIDPVPTDARGEFTKVLPPGEYAIEVRARGYVAKRYRVPIERAKRTMIEVSLAAEQQVGMLAGRIVSFDGAPLAGLISFAQAGVAPVPADPDTGEFEVVLDAGTYEITVAAEGFVAKRFRIPVLAGKKTVQEFRLEAEAKAEVSGLARREGDRIVTRNDVEFEPGTSLLTDDAYTLLEAVAQVYLANPNRRLRIEAHTHNLGPAEANQKLSEERANAVREFLLTLGVASANMRAVGMGEEHPLVDNNSQEGRLTNERVEFFLE